jgi:preprotein translocase subunit YajC
VDDGGQVLQQVLFFGLLILGLYLLAIRPQRARARALAQVRHAVQVGSQVITTAGIHGTVVDLQDEQALLEIAPGVQVRFVRAAIVALVEPASEPPVSDKPVSDEAA